MSDEEDWMALADKPIEEIKANAGDKEVVDFVDKPKQETKIETQPRNEENAAKKNKLNEAGKKLDEKRKLYEDAFDEKKPKGPLTQEQRIQSELLSKKSDERNINELFMDVSEDKQQQLQDREAYIALAKKVGEIVGNAKLKIYIQDFMGQLVEELYPKVSSAEYQDILDKVKVLFNQKQKEEKPPTKSKKKAPTANITKATVKSTSTKYAGDNSDDYDEDFPTGKGKFNPDEDLM